MSYQLFTVVILTLLSFVSCHKHITIFSDFNNNDDLLFFKRTFPWIVENAGLDINFLFRFKDSNEKSVRRQCSLSQLSLNTYLQAEYLSCEANGNTDCIKTLPLDIYHLNKCIRTKARYFARKANKEFKRLRIYTTPAIFLSMRQIYENVAPEELLKIICALYHEMKKPQGCLKPSPIPDHSNSSSTIIPEHKSENTSKPTEATSKSTITPSDTKTTTSTGAEKIESKTTKPDEDKKSKNNSSSNQKSEMASNVNKWDNKNVEKTTIKIPNNNNKLQTSTNTTQGSKVNKPNRI